jgi:hypothetical protein
LTVWLPIPVVFCIDPAASTSGCGFSVSRIDSMRAQTLSGGKTNNNPDNEFPYEFHMKVYEFSLFFLVCTNIA